MRLNEIQILEKLNRDRHAAGCAAISIDLLGERECHHTVVLPCHCGATCMMSSAECAGQVTVLLPGAMALLHACEFHMSQIVGGPPTPSLRG